MMKKKTDDSIISKRLVGIDAWSGGIVGHVSGFCGIYEVDRLIQGENESHYRMSIERGTPIYIHDHSDLQLTHTVFMIVYEELRRAITQINPKEGE